MSKGKWSEERKKAWSEKCRLTNANNKSKKESTVEEKELKRLRSIEYNKKYWTPERRAEQSARMKQKVLENPDSYSKSNVSGRVKMYDVVDYNGPTKVKGLWELKVANWLNANNVRWTNTIEPYKYQYNNSWHLYFPDFLLLDTNILIEVKGYQTDRDLAKWKSVNKKLIVLKKKHMLSLEKSIAGWNIGSSLVS
jgi:hypothetical protein